MENKKSQRGFARAASLSPERRSDIAKKASRSRANIIKATHGADEKPLIIGNSKIPCYVLSNGKRVLIQKEMALSIGLSKPNSNALSTFSKGKFAGVDNVLVSATGYTGAGGVEIYFENKKCNTIL